MLIGTHTICGHKISEITRTSQRRIRYQCEDCQNEFTTTYHNYCKGQDRRDNNGMTYCKPCSCRISAEKLRGRPSPLKGIKRPNFRGANNPGWKGGSYIDAYGYRMIYIGNHEAGETSGWKRYRKEHQVVMEKKLNRPISKGEVVHHIDGDKLNNNPENLALFPDDKTHRIAHNDLERLAMSLVKAGLICWDNNQQTYMAHIKLRELLEHPEEGNQQPSLGSDPQEGSTTSSNDLSEIMKDHERGAPQQGDDIV